MPVLGMLQAQQTKDRDALADCKVLERALKVLDQGTVHTTGLDLRVCFDNASSGIADHSPGTYLHGTFAPAAKMWTAEEISLLQRCVLGMHVCTCACSHACSQVELICVIMVTIVSPQLPTSHHQAHDLCLQC